MEIDAPRGVRRHQVNKLLTLRRAFVSLAVVACELVISVTASQAERMGSDTALIIYGRRSFFATLYMVVQQRTTNIFLSIMPADLCCPKPTSQANATTPSLVEPQLGYPELYSI
jgi:hypothetical protein